MTLYCVASEACIKELRSQLQRSQAHVESLQQELKEKSSKQKLIHTPRKQSEDSEPITIGSSDTGDEGQTSIAASVKRRSLKRKVCVSFTALPHCLQSSQGNPPSKLDPKCDFLESLTCLNVQVLSNDSTTIYHCTLDDGQLMGKPLPINCIICNFPLGHEFDLELDSQTWEYTYRPTSLAQSLSSDNDLAEPFYFPDYMLPRFLVKLLNATYENYSLDEP